MNNLLSLKPNETRMASLTIGVMLLTSTGAALGGTGIETLFFARFGVEYLPYMFVGLGITSMLMSFGMTALLSRVPKQILYVAIPLLVSIILIVARFGLLSNFKWMYPALWLGKEVLNTLIGLVIWGIAGAVCDTRQAKRLFPLFNASRILGQVIGGFFTGLLVASIGTENLLIVWAGALILAFILSRALLAGQQITSAPQRKSKRKQPTLAQEMQRGYQYVRGSSLMTWISISTIFFSILYFSISLPFSRAATENYVNEDSLASFLGLFNGISTAIAFLASLFLANRLYARIGIMSAILALPIIYLIGFGSLILAPAFIVIVAFRFVQTIWLSGLADSAWQAMFNSVPSEKRDQVRTFIDGVPSQAGTFIAGGILIIGEKNLTPQQLYIIGFIAAACCTYVIHQARRGYNLALVDALRAGRPQLFFSEEQPFGGFHQDRAAIQTALNGLHNPDPIVRRISAEIVGHLSLPESTNALIIGLSDVDSLVRLSALKALSHSKATPALLDIAASLSDPEPDVRSQAITTLTTLSPTSPALTKLLTPLLDDEHAIVSTRAALSILVSRAERSGSADEAHAVSQQAKQHLRSTAVLGDLESRTHAIHALGEWDDKEAFDFLANELRDTGIEPVIKNSILTALAQINATESIPYLLEALKDISSRQTSAKLLGNIGASITDSIINLLDDEPTIDGALLTLEHLPPPPPKPILEFARMAVSRSSEYDALRRSIQASGKNEALSLLEESLHEKSNQYGIQALRAIGLLGNRDSMNLAIENLQSRDAGQRANVIEALESISAKYRDIIQPLTKLWEDDTTTPVTRHPNWERLSNDPDAWIRECAAFAQHYGEKMETLATLSLMDRILFFKRVPLFTNFSPMDLKQVATLADEEVFSDGEEIAREGEVGDVMFIIISGEIKVCSQREGQEYEIARRKVGDYVGEMSIIGREPRMASLVAVGDARTLSIDQKSFEGLIRERPDVSLAIMQALTQRLKEASLKK